MDRLLHDWCIPRIKVNVPLPLHFTHVPEEKYENNPHSKAHGANMEPTWVLSAADGPHVGTMILAIREKIVHYTLYSTFRCMTSVTGVESLYNVFHVMTSLWVLSDRQMLHVHLYLSHPCHVSSHRTWHHHSERWGHTVKDESCCK